MTLEEYARQQQSEETVVPARKKTSLEVKQQEAGNAKQQAFEVYTRYQDNIGRTEQLSVEILKGLQCGEPLAELFLKAVKALSLCTSNKADYDIIEDTLLTVYGTAFHEREVTEILSGQIRKRLELLETALQSAKDESERIRLRQAIQAHRDRLDILTIS